MITIPSSPLRHRVCLKCNKKFESTGPGNRICRPCTEINNRHNVPEAVVARERGLKRHRGEVIECRDTQSVQYSF